MNELTVGRLIKTIHDRLRMRADAELMKYNLTLSQCRVHGFLNHNGGKATQKEIEVYLDVSHPTVVGIISRMEKAGHVVTCTDENDKRNKIVTLTEESRAFGYAMQDSMMKREEMILQSLSAEEISELKRMLGVICRNLDDGTEDNASCG